MADASAPGLMCERDRTPTRLTCATCGTPICPKCFVRTDVGLRCPACAVGSGPSVGRSGLRWVWLTVPVVVTLAFAAVVLFGSLGSRDAAPPAATERDPEVEAGPKYLPFARPDVGFSVELPPNWVPSPDEPGSASALFARSASTQSWVRVYRRDTSLTVPEILDQLTEALGKQGGSGFARQPTLLSTLPAFRLDLKLPVLLGGAGPPSSQTYLLVKRDASVFTLVLSTTDPAREGPDLAHVASTFRLL